MCCKVPRCWLSSFKLVVGSMEGSSLVAILAQWIASMVVIWSCGCVILAPIHFEDFASLDEPQIMSSLCGELYCVSCVGHVRGEE